MKGREEGKYFAEARQTGVSPIQYMLLYLQETHWGVNTAKQLLSTENHLEQTAMAGRAVQEKFLCSATSLSRVGKPKALLF